MMAARSTPGAVAGVVTVEFGLSSAQRFDDLVPAGARRLRLDPLTTPGLAQHARPAQDQAAHWANIVSDAHFEQILILSYCGASAFALRLARLLLAGGVGVRTALFDPVLFGRDEACELLREYAREAGADDGPLPPDRPPANPQPPDLTDLAPAAALTVGRDYLRSVLLGCNSLTDTLRDQLLDRRSAWLSFVLTATTWPPAPAGPVHAFLSADATWPGPAEPASMLRLPVPAQRLLTAQAAIEAVSNLLPVRS